MTIEKIANGTEITLALDGWLDTAASPQLGEKLGEIEEASALILDFAKVEYISSAGLRQVVACDRKAKEKGWSFAVINACENVKNVFTLTGMDKKISIS